jgi:hypothetical protein
MKVWETRSGLLVARMIDGHRLPEDPLRRMLNIAVRTSTMVPVRIRKQIYLAVLFHRNGAPVILVRQTRRLLGGSNLYTSNLCGPLQVKCLVFTSTRSPVLNLRRNSSFTAFAMFTWFFHSTVIPGHLATDLLAQGETALASRNRSIAGFEKTSLGRIRRTQPLHQDAHEHQPRHERYRKDVSTTRHSRIKARTRRS